MRKKTQDKYPKIGYSHYRWTPSYTDTESIIEALKKHGKEDITKEGCGWSASFPGDVEFTEDKTEIGGCLNFLFVSVEKQIDKGTMDALVKRQEEGFKKEFNVSYVSKSKLKQIKESVRETLEKDAPVKVKTVTVLLFPSRGEAFICTTSEKTADSVSYLLSESFDNMFFFTSYNEAYNKISLVDTDEASHQGIEAEMLTWLLFRAETDRYIKTTNFTIVAAVDGPLAVKADDNSTTSGKEIKVTENRPTQSKELTMALAQGKLLCSASLMLHIYHGDNGDLFTCSFNAINRTISGLQLPGIDNPDPSDDTQLIHMDNLCLFEKVLQELVEHYANETIHNYEETKKEMTEWLNTRIKNEQ
jgi:hypothetical protein